MICFRKLGCEFIGSGTATDRENRSYLLGLCEIARRARVDGYRRTRRITAHEIATEILPEPRPRLEPPPSSRLSRRSSALLPESQREVVTMLKVGGLSLEEVARATSCTVGAVSKQKSASGLRAATQTAAGGKE